MSAVLIGITISGFFLNKFTNSFTNKISDRIVGRLTDRKKKVNSTNENDEVDEIPSKMTQKYPMITGLSVPWLTTQGVSDGFNIENIQTKVAFDKNYAVVRLNVKDLEEIPEINVVQQVLRLGLPHHSHLEIDDVLEDPMDLEIPLKTSLQFDSRIKELLQNDIHLTKNYLEIPLEFTSPVNQVNALFSASSNYQKSINAPLSAKSHYLEPQIKTKLDIPFYRNRVDYA
ncbi:MAG: hypothetical protein GPJ54_19850 [Candidatus Heimdallarchaeota archaeon]|nr:hypothetical protein [Candidatus Heimdallarchaeota archaeon]